MPQVFTHGCDHASIGLWAPPRANKASLTDSRMKLTSLLHHAKSLGGIQMSDELVGCLQTKNPKSCNLVCVARVVMWTKSVERGAMN